MCWSWTLEWSRIEYKMCQVFLRQWLFFYVSLSFNWNLNRNKPFGTTTTQFSTCKQKIPEHTNLSWKWDLHSKHIFETTQFLFYFSLQRREQLRDNVCKGLTWHHIAPSASQGWELGVRDHSPSAFDVALQAVFSQKPLSFNINHQISHSKRKPVSDSTKVWAGGKASGDHS